MKGTKPNAAVNTNNRLFSRSEARKSSHREVRTCADGDKADSDMRHAGFRNSSRPRQYRRARLSNPQDRVAAGQWCKPKFPLLQGIATLPGWARHPRVGSHLELGRRQREARPAG